MRLLIRPAALLLTALATLGACHRAADEITPAVALRGEWRLAVSGGGFTGVMTPVKPDYDARVVFGPGSAYAEYTNGKLVRASTFQLRTQASQGSGPDEQVLLIKTTSITTGQPIDYPYYITLLTADKLHFTTGGGCALNVEYVRTNAASPTPTL